MRVRSARVNRHRQARMGTLVNALHFLHLGRVEIWNVFVQWVLVVNYAFFLCVNRLQVFLALIHVVTACRVNCMLAGGQNLMFLVGRVLPPPGIPRLQPRDLNFLRSETAGSRAAEPASWVA